jgi:hypothetical protein
MNCRRYLQGRESIWGSEVQLQAFLILKTDRSESATQNHNHFTPKDMELWTEAKAVTEPIEHGRSFKVTLSL